MQSLTQNNFLWSNQGMTRLRDEWSCEHCGKGSRNHQTECDHCGSMMCDRCTLEHDNDDSFSCPVKAGESHGNEA